MAGLTLTKVIHEHHPVEVNRKGVQQSFGAILDEMLGKAVAKGETIQTVRFDFDTESMAEVELLRDMYLARK